MQHITHLPEVSLVAGGENGLDGEGGFVEFMHDRFGDRIRTKDYPQVIRVILLELVYNAIEDLALRRLEVTIEEHRGGRVGRAGRRLLRLDPEFRDPGRRWGGLNQIACSALCGSGCGTRGRNRRLRASEFLAVSRAARTQRRGEHHAGQTRASGCPSIARPLCVVDQTMSSTRFGSRIPPANDSAHAIRALLDQRDRLRQDHRGFLRKLHRMRNTPDSGVG